MSNQEPDTINKSILLNWLYKQKRDVSISELEAYIKSSTKTHNLVNPEQKD